MRRVIRAQRSTSFLALGLLLMVIQAGVRIALVATGNFYWDDLIIVGQASSNSVFSLDYLAQNHDGHFMPGAFFVAGIVNAITPLHWALPATTLVVLSTIAAAAVWRLLTIVARAGSSRRRQVVVLAAFAFYLFSPMTVPSFVWWSAGLNSLPLQAAMAWIIGDALLLCSGGVDSRRRRVIVVRSALILLLALMFFEKALFIAPVAFGVAALWVRWRLPASTTDALVGDGPGMPTTPLTVTFTRARALWVTMAVLTTVWAVIFLSVTDGASGSHSLTQTAKLVWRSVNSAIVPAVVGGPWQWERWIPSPPMAEAPPWAIVLGWVAVVAIGVFAVMRFPGALMVIACAAIYVIGVQIPVMWNRSAVITAPELAETLRYLPDAALVLAIAGVLVAMSPRRVGQESSSRVPAWSAAVIVAVLGLSSLWTTATFGRSWHDNPTAAYLANGRASFNANPDFAMFDQAVPLEVLLPVTFPANQISRVFGGLRHGPTIVTSTSNLKVLDTKGRLVPGGVTSARRFDVGSGTCGRPEVRAPSSIRLDGPLIRWRWTVALSYCANTSGEAELRLGDGPPVRFLVDAGLHVVYVQLDGHGSVLQVAPRTAGLALHTGAGRVGEVAEAQLLG
ncbi:hypothetical protein [Gordonia sp. CPCC 205333]|uniref:hypothetical protein n=1 Tax=Gordonia sp. CPCC 205333 TaxID=3140790 RepID=UPI003AF3E988